ncbi:hypothetical protein QAD02_007185 [Eretmocerus hayati]|uniref:Uncharacterized protein n=1 Tax=Eretmocerus hayati TaxID=131215 RepID=A0ACC2N473_9HYME|nr:hypothetical protein QAD02_007185 [Eretmocerus hayati]
MDTVLRSRGQMKSKRLVLRLVYSVVRVSSHIKVMLSRTRSVLRAMGPEIGMWFNRKYLVSALVVIGINFSRSIKWLFRTPVYIGPGDRILRASINHKIWRFYSSKTTVNMGTEDRAHDQTLTASRY